MSLSKSECMESWKISLQEVCSLLLKVNNNKKHFSPVAGCVLVVLVPTVVFPAALHECFLEAF